MDVALADRLTYEPTTFDDLEALVELRIAAMRESLDRLNIFDPDRARARLAESFEPNHTRWFLLDGARIGFYALIPYQDGHKISHFYVRPGHHGLGIGSEVMRSIIAQNPGFPIYLNALQKSDANRFYERHGFQATHEDELDIYYVRPASA